MQDTTTYTKAETIFDGKPFETTVSVPKEDISVSDGSEIYRVGTLSYTRRNLIILFSWMLWGGVCYGLMETVVPSVLPLNLKRLGASNTIIAMIMSVLPGLLNITICPWISFKSDRYRSPMGRRIPFIIYTAPFLTLFLILLGYSETIGRWLSTKLSEGYAITEAGVCVCLMGTFMVCFQFFNMFVASVYAYLVNDVIPEKVMSRYMSMGAIIGGLSGVCYNIYVFPYAETHMKDIFLWAALLYFIGFGLVCFKVREGKYPPPPENTGGKVGFWAGVRTFVYESYGLAYYWYKYLGASFAFIAVASVGAFLIFFYKDIGLSLEQIGKIAGYVGVVGMVLAMPAGIVADRFNPARVFIITQVIGILICPAYLVFLFMDMSNQQVFYYHLAISILVAINGTFAAVSAGPFEMRSFPRERFGQFCSAQSIVRVLLSVIIGLGIGIIFDLLKDHYQSDFCYRYVYIGVLFFQILGFCCYYIFYRKWKKYGGETNYKPPIWTPTRG